MSVLTLPAQPGQDTVPAPVPWQRMLWVTWRQHRTMLTGIASVLAAAAVFLLIAGLKVRQDYAGLAHCDFATVVYPSACATKISHFNNTDWTLGNTCLIFMNLAPALIGAFTGPALLARELETGTFRYVWTQGIGRVRWTIAKLTLLGVFDTRGLDFAAWTLVAFMIGAFLGMLIRRIIPAMAATLGAYLGVMLLAWLVLREDAPVSRFWPTQFIESGWLLVLAIVLGAAAITPLFTWLFAPFLTTQQMPATSIEVFETQGVAYAAWTLLGVCMGAFAGALVRRVLPAMAVTLGLYAALVAATVGYLRDHYPVSTFWPMQFFEGGWLLVLSALLIWGTVWVVRRQAA